MEKRKNYIFFDEIFVEYVSKFGKEGESFFVEDLKSYLEDLSKTSQITLITSQDAEKIADWLLKNNMDQLIDNIANPSNLSFERKED